MTGIGCLGSIWTSCHHMKNYDTLGINCNPLEYLHLVLVGKGELFIGLKIYVLSDPYIYLFGYFLLLGNPKPGVKASSIINLDEGRYNPGIGVFIILLAVKT